MIFWIFFVSGDLLKIAAQTDFDAAASCQFTYSWFSYNDTLYAVSNNTVTDYDTARQCCQCLGPNVRLTVMENDDDDVTGLLTHIWDLFGTGADNIWVDATRMGAYPTPFTWPDGRNVSGNLWSKFEPQQADDCARFVVNKKSLSGRRCFYLYNSFCQGYTPASPPAGTCDLDLKWMSVAGHVYGISSNVTDLETARQCCASYGPYFRLAVFDDVSSADNITLALKSHVDPLSDLWLDVFLLELNTGFAFVWSNGQPVSENMWANQPGNNETVARLVMSLNVPRLKGIEEGTDFQFSVLCQEITAASEIPQMPLTGTCTTESFSSIVNLESSTQHLSTSSETIPSSILSTPSLELLTGVQTTLSLTSAGFSVTPSTLFIGTFSTIFSDVSQETLSSEIVAVLETSRSTPSTASPGTFSTVTSVASLENPSMETMTVFETSGSIEASVYSLQTSFPSDDFTWSVSESMYTFYPSSVVLSTSVEYHTLSSVSETTQSAGLTFISTRATTQMATYFDGTFSEWTLQVSAESQATGSFSDSYGDNQLEPSLQSELNGLTSFSEWTEESTAEIADSAFFAWSVDPSVIRTDTSVSEEMSSEPNLTLKATATLTSETVAATLSAVRQNITNQPCSCVFPSGHKIQQNETSAEVQEKIHHIRAYLSVNKTTLSRTMRKKISAHDKRRSARAVGCVGLVSMVVVFLPIILLDIQGLAVSVLRKLSGKISPRANDQ